MTQEEKLAKICSDWLLGNHEQAAKMIRGLTKAQLVDLILNLYLHSIDIGLNKDLKFNFTSFIYRVVNGEVFTQA